LTTIDLGPLDRRESLLLAGEFIDATQSVALACVERADGNPLFLEQLLRNAKEGSEETLPGSIRSLVLARMDRLPPTEQQALQAASVILCSQLPAQAGLMDLAGRASSISNCRRRPSASGTQSVRRLTGGGKGIRTRSPAQSGFVSPRQPASQGGSVSKIQPAGIKQLASSSDITTMRSSPIVIRRPEKVWTAPVPGGALMRT
jgi:hypothetical protein